ncbi:MAG: maleylacetate reductase [Pseudonocardia sp.]|nr:maleylacetate reductase [Pseudonocardia sp.]
MRSFRHRALPMRVTFGAGRVAELPAELDELGLHRVLVLSTPGRQRLALDVAQSLGDRSVGVHPHASEHVPAQAAAGAAKAATAAAADGCVAVGGGSTIGLGKALALELGLPVVAVPTTYSGSEMTPVWGLTDDTDTGSTKRTGRDDAVLPRSVVYDPELTLGLPVDVSVTSGFNALAHAVEALYAPDGSPVTALLAAEGVRALAGALPAVAAKPRDVDVRGDALYGAWLCGSCLGATTMGLHHQLAHILGGSFGLSHAATHTVLLPHVLAFNTPAAPDADAALRRALDTDRPAAALQALAAELGAPTTLQALGFGAGDIDDVARRAAAKPYANPRAVTVEGVREVLVGAVRGTQL